MQEKLFTTREVSHTLGISEKDVIELANKNLIPHFKVAGEFLRFRKEDILRIKPAIKKKYNLPEKNYRSLEQVREFVYFNDFYLASAMVIIFLLWIIIKDLALGG